MDIKELLFLTIKNKASDLHLLVGLPPTFRIDGVLRPLGSYPVLRPEDLEQMVYALLTPEQKELLLAMTIAPIYLLQIAAFFHLLAAQVL